MGRAAARETLFKLIYEYAVRKERDDFTLSLLTSGADSGDADYIKSSYDGILTNESKILEKIGTYSRAFAIDRIYKVDLAILSVAIYEIMFRDDIPYSVSANEATELAKKYSTDNSYSFVNGILASVIKEMNNENN